MGFFSTILEKLGMGKAVAAPAPPAAPTAQAPASTSPGTSPGTSTSTPAPEREVVNPIAMVDVVAQLEQRAKNNSQKLNWRTSIVDLLKLLDMDSSLDARKALAKELYCPPELMNDSAKMNTWLHRNVLAHVAANGGNVPKELLD